MIFGKIWGLIDEEEPPEPTTQEATWPKVLLAAALEGVVFKTTRVAVDRVGAIGWRNLTGVWPSEKRPDPEGPEASGARPRPAAGGSPVR